MNANDTKSHTSKRKKDALAAAHTKFIRRASIPLFTVMLILSIILILDGEIPIGIVTFFLGSFIASVWRLSTPQKSDRAWPFDDYDEKRELPIDDPRNPAGINNPISPISYQWQKQHRHNIDSTLTPPTDHIH